MGSIKFSRSIILFLAALFCYSLTSCSYSFSGSSVPSHLKTIAIPIFVDKSGSGEFDLNQRLTKQVIQKFIDDNSLLVSDKLNSNAQLEGTITAISDAPAVVSGGEKISSRRITISVRIIYKDNVKKQQIFDRNFSNYGDYPVGGDITSVRKQAIETAIDRIAEDILLGVVSNW